MYMSESMNASAGGGQKREPDPPAPEFEVAGSYLTGVLGTKLGSSGRAVHAFNC